MDVEEEGIEELEAVLDNEMVFFDFSFLGVTSEEREIKELVPLALDV